MKRMIVIAAVISFLTVSIGVARASDPALDDYEDSMTHPLRIAYYLAHPIGFAAEWLIGRPFHYVISRPYLDRFFGYQPNEESGMGRRCTM